MSLRSQMALCAAHGNSARLHVVAELMQPIFQLLVRSVVSTPPLAVSLSVTKNHMFDHCACLVLENYLHHVPT
jgi:hypothetical protein